MCLLAISFQQLDDAPLAVAANREEFFDRPSLGPAVQETSPRVLCGTDARAGGTWLGVNEHGVLAAVTNRGKSLVPLEPRSRGLLCRELLNFNSAAEAADYAHRELSTGQYAGANFFCADSRSATVLHGGDVLERINLSPGLHLLANGDLNDPDDRRLAFAHGFFVAESPEDSAQFVAAGRALCRQGPDHHGGSIVLRPEDRGTVSSTLIALTRDVARAQYLHTPGPPDLTSYEDYSGELCRLLS